MRISKEEIIKLAHNIKLDLTEAEIIEIGDSIEEITKSLDEMLDIETTDERKIMGNENLSNVFSNHEDDGITHDEITSHLNNYDGEYVNVIKMEENDEA